MVGGYSRRMPTDDTVDDMVAEAALQLWSAAQTDFDPFEVPSEQWPEQAVPVRDAGEVVAALSVVLPRDAPTGPALEALRAAARGVEETLAATRR